LNYKRRPIRAVRIICSDGHSPKDATFGSGSWQVNHAYGAPFHIAVSYGEKDASGSLVYHSSTNAVQPPSNVETKTSWPGEDPARYSKSDTSHVINVPLYFEVR